MKIVNSFSGRFRWSKKIFRLYSESLSDMDEEVVSVVRKGAAIELILNEKR